MIVFTNPMKKPENNENEGTPEEKAKLLCIDE